MVSHHDDVAQESWRIFMKRKKNKSKFKVKVIEDARIRFTATAWNRRFFMSRTFKQQNTESGYDGRFKYALNFPIHSMNKSILNRHIQNIHSIMASKIHIPVTLNLKPKNVMVMLSKVMYIELISCATCNMQYAV